MTFHTFLLDDGESEAEIPKKLIVNVATQVATLGIARDGEAVLTLTNGEKRSILSRDKDGNDIEDWETTLNEAVGSESVSRRPTLRRAARGGKRVAVKRAGPTTTGRGRAAPTTGRRRRRTT